MPRMEHRFAITLHDRYTKDKFTFHLGQTGVIGRFWSMFKGRKSKAYPEITGTEVGRKISGWLKTQQQKRWY